MKRTELKRTERPTAVFRCVGCGVLFRRRADHKPRNAAGLVLCTPCSRAQAASNAVGRTYPSRRTGRDVVCKQCGVTFYRRGSRLGAGQGKFCNRACQAAWQREHEPPPNLIGSADNSGEKNGRYRHGKRVGGHVPKRTVRNQVIDRDGDWCLLCGRPPKGLHLHRVVYGSQGGKYEVANCVQLCGEHHALAHSSKRTWQPRLLAYIADPSDRSPLAEFRDAREEAS